jgi:hypothetical protein
VLIYNNSLVSTDVISISGNARVTLTAPSSGTYQGIVIFQSRTSTAGITISDHGSLILTGILYAPKAKIKVSDNALLQLLGDLSELIAADLTVSDNAVVKVDI